jgi:predicted transcriptional regulator
MLAGRRGVLEIIASILNGLTENPLKKTHVTYKANLDSRAASKYMELLVRLQLVTRSEYDPTYFTITQKGREFLGRYEELTKIVEI